ncbi:hypothetical protein, partial [Cereibacter sphaeroides]|uniref:hypothetical protein n=1 Tax=Cereibacter sphaeroides TaxID=1063 RepID=UPI001F25EA6F
MTSVLTTTTRLRLPAGPHDAELDRTGQLFGRLERLLHVRLRAIDRGTVAEGEPATRNAVKTDFCSRYGITARHFNSLIRALDGKHAGIVAKAGLDAEDAEARLRAVRKKLDRNRKTLDAHVKAAAGIAERAARGKAPTKGQAKALLNDRDRTALLTGLFGRTRKEARLAARLAEARGIAALTVPPIVFGGRKLLKARPADAASPEFADWKRRWREARASQILCVGSKDEPGGSQCCRPLWTGWEAGTMSLR